MDRRTAHLTTGLDGELFTAKFLQTLGWKILARNWRPQGRERGLELDIIAKDGKTIVFVEVKTRQRQTVTKGIPTAAAFTTKKQQCLLRAAKYFLSSHDAWDAPCRFDLFCLDKQSDGQYTVEHFKNVIEIWDIVDSKHTPWQPW